MDYSLVCYGTHNKSCERCLINCPDRNECEKLSYILRWGELKGEDNNENGKDEQR